MLNGEALAEGRSRWGSGVGLGVRFHGWLVASGNSERIGLVDVGSPGCLLRDDAGAGVIGGWFGIFVDRRVVCQWIFGWGWRRFRRFRHLFGFILFVCGLSWLDSVAAAVRGLGIGATERLGVRERFRLSVRHRRIFREGRASGVLGGVGGIVGRRVGDVFRVRRAIDWQVSKGDSGRIRASFCSCGCGRGCERHEWSWRRASCWVRLVALGGGVVGAAVILGDEHRQF